MARNAGFANPLMTVEMAFILEVVTMVILMPEYLKPMQAYLRKIGGAATIP
jgi:hypothetical protein